MASVIGVPGVDGLSPAELRALEKAARRLGVDVDWLATIISFESAGTFSPSKLNAAGSGAFGLIQFLPTTAARLLALPKAEAVERGRAMSFTEQLNEMVVPYFESFRRRFESLEDLYAAVFYPVAMGKPASYVIGASPSKVYTQNRGLDREGKGFITAGDMTGAITRAYQRSVNAPRVFIRATVWPWFLLPVGAVAALYLTDRYAPAAYRLPNVPALRPVRSALTTTEREVSTWPAKARTLARSLHSPVQGLSRWAFSSSKT